jgi:hypothetical protein
MLYSRFILTIYYYVPARGIFFNTEASKEQIMLAVYLKKMVLSMFISCRQKLVSRKFSMCLEYMPESQFLPSMYTTSIYDYQAF